MQILIYINNNKDIKFFSQDFIDITLKAGRNIEKPKKHYLVLEVAVLSLEGCFRFIVFFYPYSIINTCKIKLNKLFGLI